MQNEQVQIYQYSGRIGLKGFGLVFMIVLGILSLPLAIIYVLATYYIPFVYINFLLTACFGAVCGYAVAIGGKLGKVRSVPLYFILGLLVGIAAEYCQWVAWVYVHSGYKQWVLAPEGIYSFISAVAVDGFWSIFGVTVKGKLLYTFWIIEGLMIIGCASLGAYGFLLGSPFCEYCQRWFKAKDNLYIMPLDPIVDPAAISSHLIAGDCSALLALNMKLSKGDSYTKLQISTCPACDRFHILSVYAITVEYDGESEDEYEDPVIENLMITGPMFQSITTRYLHPNPQIPQPVTPPLQTVTA